MFSFDFMMISVITGMGEMQAQDSPRRVAVDTSRPYLLIDARDTDDYEKCHIAEGRRQILFICLFLCCLLV